jgi:hypothetical protein
LEGQFQDGPDGASGAAALFMWFGLIKLQQIDL